MELVYIDPIKSYLFRPWELVIDLCKEAHVRWQRGNRGWADCDVWSIEYYLSRIVPPMLLKLKKEKTGIPGVFFFGGKGKPEVSVEIAEQRWNEALDQMYAGFFAAHMQDELGFGNPDKCDELEKIRIKGMRTFAKYYHCLWD